MKKIAVILLLLIYSVSSIGATINMHYCMGSYVDWSLIHSDDEKCGKCGMKESADKKGCCKDEQKEIKIKAEHQKGSVENYSAKIFFTPAIISTFPFVEFICIGTTKLTYTYFHPPPNIASTKLHILYGVFLI